MQHTCAPSTDTFFRGGNLWPQPDTVKVHVSQPYLLEQDLRAVQEVLAEGWIGSQAPVVFRFEEALSERLGQNSLAVANGSVALILALTALGVGPGDEVIVPSLTYAATASSVLHVGAVPIFVDVDPIDWCLDSSLLEQILTERTKAIIAVNLYGVTPNLQFIKTLCDQHGISMIEDSAENFLGTYGGKPAGTVGHVGTFSFFANKTLHLGEGGAVTTADLSLLERMKSLRGQGMSSTVRYLFDIPGFNFRLAAPQAALGASLLARVDRTIERRAEIESLYDQVLEGVAIRPGLVDGAIRAPWIYTAQLQGLNPVKVAAKLSRHSIETRPVFIPMTQNPAFKNEVCTGCTVASALHLGGISLPTYEDLDLNTVREICHLIVSEND